MGAGAISNGNPRSPHERLKQQKCREAKKGRYVEGETSAFYKCCEIGDIDGVREILERTDRDDMSTLFQREKNGDTALHIAVKNKHHGVARLLLESKCPRNILDREAKYAFEYADTPLGRNYFDRADNSSRFHDSDMTGKISCYVHEESEEKSSNADIQITPSDTTKNDLTSTENNDGFVLPFKSEEETYKYALDQQTTAMWLRLYNWLSRTFPRFFQHDFLRPDIFDLDKNQDFKDFLKNRCQPHEADNTLNAIVQAKTKSTIEPLIEMYTSERACYRSLNKQLASSTQEHESAPHLCDRFIMEFYIRAEQLEKRIFIGNTYRGATINNTDIHVYEQALNNKTRGVLAFKTFTSTSENKDIALNFMNSDIIKDAKLNVLFVLTVKDKSTNIFSVEDLSEYPHEQEVLIMPGTLFMVTEIKRDVKEELKSQKTLLFTEIHLKYHHIPMSFWKKLGHTIKSARSEAL